MITSDEKIILKNLPIKFKYIARHNSLKGELYIFEYKPYIKDGFFRSYGHQMPCNQFRHIFETVKKGKCYEISKLIS